MAETITSNHNGEITLNSGDKGNNPLTIDAGVTVSAGGSYAVYTSYYQSWSITNLGTLLGKYGVLLNDGDTFPGSVLTNSGTGALIYGTKIGVEVLGSFSTVTNQGTILGGSGDGVDLDADSDSVTNSGTGALIQGGRDGVYANATPNATAVVSNLGTISGISGDGVFLTGGGSVTNSTTGALIEGDTNGVAAAGTSTVAVTNFGTINGISGDGVSLAAGGKVTNSGTGAAIYGGTNAVYATNVSVAVVNTGLILTTNNDGVYLDAGGTVTNNSTLAVIDGYVYGVRVKGAAGTVTNLGRIIGNVAGVDFLHGGTLANNGTAALVSGLSWGGYFGAGGGAVTVTNQGSFLGKGGIGVNLGDGGALTNSGTGALISGADYGIVAFGQYLTLVNSGRISGGSGGGVYLGAGATLTNSATAQIAGAASGILANNDPIYVVNEGTIAGTGTGGTGVDVESGGTLTNSGTGALIYGVTYGIEAIVQAFTVVNYAKISAHAGVGVYFGGGGSVTNGATARIDGATYGVLARNTAIGVVNQGTIAGTKAAGIDLTAGGTVTNSGTAALISGARSGIAAPGGAATVANQGTITGTGYYGLILGQGGAVTNSAEAVIYGGADGIYSQAGGALTLTNQGGITGGSGGFFGVNLQDGGVVLNSGTGASIAGNDGGLWAQHVAATVSNQGSIVGAAGEGMYLGAGGTVTNSGTGAFISGNFGIKVLGGAATVTNQGSIVGKTNSGVYLGDGGQVTNSTTGHIGGAVNAVVGLNVAIGVLNQGSIAGTAKAGIYLNAGGTVTNSGTAALISGAKYGIEIVGGAATVIDQGTISGTTDAVKFASASGNLFELYPGANVSGIVNGGANGAATLELGSGSPAGAISGISSQYTGFKVFDVAAGARWTVSGSNTIARNASLSVDGSATLTLSGKLVALGQPTLEGSGTIAMSGTGAMEVGTNNNATAGEFLVDQGQTVVTDGAVSFNQILNRGVVTGLASYGLYLGAGGAVTNFSLGHVSGVDDGIAAKGAASVVNTGSITGTSQSGVYLGAGGSVTNNLTGALISGGVNGVNAKGAATVTNLGTILGTSSYGVRLQAGGTVVNSGSIIGGGDAVQFGANFTNRLVVDPGAVFYGKVDGGNAVGSGTISTLELTSGTSAGTLHGLGSQYVNFAQTTIDAGASWTLTGYNALASGATLTNAGTLTLSSATLTDSGVLTNNGALTLDPSTLTVGSLLGTGTTTIDAGGSLEAQGTVAGGETIAFAGSNAELHLDAPDSVSGSVTNVGLGDLIDLQGIAPGSVSFTNGTLSFAGGSFALSLNGSPAVQAVASADGTLFEVVGPVIAGTTPDQPVTDVTTIDPFSGVTIADNNAGQTETVTVTLSNDANGTLSTSGAGTFNDGVFTDTGTADQVTTALQDLVFTPTFDPGPGGNTVSTTFTIQAVDTAGATATDAATSVVASAVPTAITLASFDGTGDGANPYAGLIADSSGDLFGTTRGGGENSDGTVFEIVKSGGTFASTPSTLVAFNGIDDGAFPQGGLTADAGGDLLGTTAGGGSDDAGTAFEITRFGPSDYASTPSTLATFNNANNIGVTPDAGLIADTAGDLFGTVANAAGANDGAVFEIANGTTTVTQVAGFTGGDDGGQPKGVLAADSAGDLFGTASDGGADSQGTVFEIVHTNTGYATSAIPLVTFTGGDDGGDPLGGLILDANGDLFGTTSGGGEYGDGTVFEIAHSSTGYASSPITLASFDGTGDGAGPADTLIADSNGDIFGTTEDGGADGDGTVFEIAHTATGYAGTPTTLVAFTGSGNGANPYGGLIADQSGNLYGTTLNGGANSDGTVFEVVSTGATFAPLIAGTQANQAVTDATTIDPFAAATITDGNSGQTETLTVTLSNAANGVLTGLGTGSFSGGVYTVTGTGAQVTAALEHLEFVPTKHQVAVGQTVTTTFTIQDTNTAGADATDDTTSVVATAVICFCAGTLIATPAGEVPVETLAIGDRVLTMRGAARPIAWIGSGKVMVARGRRSAATPVVLRKGALADNVPHHDLHVTKGHSFYLDGVLIPVEFLVNHRSIVWDDRAQEVTIYHVELETHDVLLANGAPAESYRDDGNRWLFRNRNSGWEQPAKAPCAPVVTGGPVVDAVWRRLLDRAGPRPGLPLTDQPDLHLLADGRRVDGSYRPNGCCVFDLPRPPSELLMVSRAGSPAELGLARDPRVLGVAVRQVRVWQGARLRVLDAADESLVEGFHAFEPDNGFRWTDGNATLPASLFAEITGACQLELLVGGAMRYPLLAEPVGQAAA